MGGTCVLVVEKPSLMTYGEYGHGCCMEDLRLADGDRRNAAVSVTRRVSKGPVSCF